MNPDDIRTGVYGLGRVEAQLDGFLAGEVRGRTLLIAGPRALGKSTLLNALFASYAKPRTGANGSLQPILRVDLHGPTLFGRVDDTAFYADLFKALHLAVVQRTADELMAMGKPALAESFRVAMLSGEADHARLLEVWRDAGVLGDNGSGLFGLSTGRARQEVTAIWLVSRAYMSLSGAYEDKKRRADARELEQTVSVTGPTAEWLTPLATLVGGGLVGTQLFPDTPLGAAGISLASLALGSVVTSATRSRKTSETRDVEFIETLDASSLERWLPVVVRQLKEVGLFPVFVVDELRIEPWTKPPDEFTKRLDGCRMVMNHGALFCLMVDGRTWLTLDHYEDALRGAVTDRTFLVARPDEMQPEGLAGADRDVVVLRARARPIALKSAVRGLAIRRPPTVLLTGNPHAQPLEAVLQRAIEAALKATRPMRDIEEAIAVDLAYAWVSAWREGAVRVAATGAADTTWARGNGWIAPDADSPARVTVFRDLLVGELTRAGVARRVGTELRLLFGPDGRRIDSWFATAAEAALWLAEAEASALSLTGLPLEHLEESAGLAPVRASSQSLGATASEPSVRQSRAEALAEHVEVLQALMVGLRVLGTYGGTATDAAGRNFGKLRRFEEHARRAWTPADTDALVTLAGLAAPGPWTPLPGPWAADVARLSKWWGGAAAPSDAAVERVREAGRRLWARRTPANADAPSDGALDPRDVLLAIVLPNAAPVVLRDR